MKENKRLVFVLLFVSCLIFISLISFVSASTCLEDQTIMKLLNPTNSKAEAWNGTANYPISICYSTIFGKTYDGANPHMCTTTNKVVGLSAETNAYAETPYLDNYQKDVCYGNLNCQVAGGADNIKIYANDPVGTIKTMNISEDSTVYLSGKSTRSDIVHKGDIVELKLVKKEGNWLSTTSYVNYSINKVFKENFSLSYTLILKNDFIKTEYYSLGDCSSLGEGYGEIVRLNKNSNSDLQLSTYQPPISIPFRWYINTTWTANFKGLYNPKDNNPYTNAKSCPENTDNITLNLADTSDDIHLCLNKEVMAMSNFGGLYTTGTSGSNNSYTDNQSCPEGFNDTRLDLGSSIGNDIHMCWNGNYSYSNFGGMYTKNSFVSGSNNPYTNAKSCPSGYNNAEYEFDCEGWDCGIYPPYILHLCWSNTLQINKSGTGIGVATQTEQSYGPISSSLKGPYGVYYTIRSNTSDVGLSFSSPFFSPQATTDFSSNILGKIDESLTLIYPVKICCKSSQLPTGNAYWASMINNPITTTSVNDSVLMIWKNTNLPAGTEINFEIYETDTGFDDAIRTGSNAISVKIDSNGEAVALWKITDVDIEKTGDYNDFIFTVKMGTDEKIRSGSLIISTTQNNYLPISEIISPQERGKFLVQENISFTQDSKDEDDDLKVLWNFADSTTATLSNCLTTGNCNTTYTYSNSGTKEIGLKTEEIERTQSNRVTREIYVYDEGINIFPVITSPRGQTSSLNIHFLADESYIANCTYLASCPHPIEIEECYTITKTINGEPKTLYCFDYPKTSDWIPLKYNLWFNWTFEDNNNLYGNWNDNKNKVVDFYKLLKKPGEYTAKLQLGYEPK